LFSSTDISYFITSLGCSKNLVDSERVNGAMKAAGYRQAGGPDDADILIINTCGFIRTAKEESIATIFEAIETQKSRSSPVGRAEESTGGNFGRKVVVIGCLTGRYISAVTSEIPEIDFIYGLPDGAFVEKMSRSLRIAIRTDAGHGREPLVPGLAYAYIKIAEGCSNNCTYCAIPFIRGPQRSYSPGSILDEVREAAGRGALEMIIVAQDISSYEYGNAGLRDVVRNMTDVQGVEWIRLMYCHPDRVDGVITDLLEHEKKVVPYIDIPLQHVSAPLVRAMGRKGDFSSYMNLVARLRAKVPDIRIRSTFMVGFPGEAERDVDELVDFLKEAMLDRVGVFMYSPEEGTGAYSLGDPVPEREKKVRYGRIMSEQREISAAKLSRMIGSTVRVIVEERLDESTWICRTEYDAPEVDGIFYLTGSDVAVNTIETARVTDTLDYDLVGVVAGSMPPQHHISP